MKQHLQIEEKNISEIDTESRVHSSEQSSYEAGDKKLHLDFRFDFAGSHPVDFTDNEAKRMRKRR